LAVITTIYFKRRDISTLPNLIVRSASDIGFNGVHSPVKFFVLTCLVSALAAAVIAAARDEAGRLAARAVNRELVVTRANRDEQMRRVEAAFKDLVVRYGR